MKRAITIPLMMVLFLKILACCDPLPPTPEPPTGVQIDLDWPQTRRTPQQIASLDSDVAFPLELAWSVRVDCKASATPILAFETLYVGCGDGRLYGLDPVNGDTQFSIRLAGAIAGLAAAPADDGFDGAILATTELNGRLYAVDPTNGSELWHLEDGWGPVVSPPTVVESSVYYTFMPGEAEGCIRAVSVEDGSVIWQRASEFYHISGPPMLYDGLDDVFAPTSFSIYSQFNRETGDHYWGHLGYNTNPWYTSGPYGMDSIDNGEDILIVIGHDVNIVASNGPGSSDPAPWVCELPNQDLITGIALTENRSPNLLVISQPQTLYTLDAQTGDILAQASTLPNDEWQNNHRTPQPVIWGDYVLHIADSTMLVAYELESLNEAWRYDIGLRTYASPIISGNAVFIATAAGTVMALYSD